AERQQRYWKRQDHEQRTNQRVDEAQHERRDQRSGERADAHPRKNVGQQEQRRRVDDPDKQKSQHSSSVRPRAPSNRALPRQRARTGSTPHPHHARERAMPTSSVTIGVRLERARYVDTEVAGL